MLTVIFLAAALAAGANSGENGGATDAEAFEPQCVAALVSDGLTARAAAGPCACIARRTQNAPDLRREFLARYKTPMKERTLATSEALRQVRVACTPMSIWSIGG